MRWDTQPPGVVDLAAPLSDNSLDRALREATGVRAGPIPPASLGAVVELRVSGHRLRDLSPLFALPALERLWVRSRHLHDLAPLQRLGALRELTLTDLPVIDLRPLGKLERLQRLRIENLPVTDLSPLGALERLEDLCLRSTLVADLKPLERLKRLRELELTDGLPLADLSVLARLPRLRYVNLVGTRVEKIGGLPARLHAVHFEGLDQPCTRVIEPRQAGGELGEAGVARLAAAVLGRPCGVRGLCDTRGAVLAFARNPWGIPSRADMPRALETLWRPLRRRAPQFAGRLRQAVGAVALLDPEGDAAPCIGYFHRGSSGEAALLVGRAPRDPASADEQGVRLPLALRELYSVHAGLFAEGTRLLPPAGVRPLAECSNRRADPLRHRGGDPLEPYRLFLQDGDGGEVLDLDRLDARGDPIVRRWYRSEDEIEGHASFWDWFEDHAADALLSA